MFHPFVRPLQRSHLCPIRPSGRDGAQAPVPPVYTRPSVHPAAAEQPAVHPAAAAVAVTVHRALCARRRPALPNRSSAVQCSLRCRAETDRGRREGRTKGDLWWTSPGAAPDRLASSQLGKFGPADRLGSSQPGKFGPADRLDSSQPGKLGPDGRLTARGCRPERCSANVMDGRLTARRQGSPETIGGRLERRHLA